MFLLLLSRELYNSCVASFICSCTFVQMVNVSQVFTPFLNASGGLQLLQRISGSLVAKCSTAGARIPSSLQS